MCSTAVYSTVVYTGRTLIFSTVVCSTAVYSTVVYTGRTLTYSTVVHSTAVYSIQYSSIQDSSI